MANIILTSGRKWRCLAAAIVFLLASPLAFFTGATLTSTPAEAQQFNRIFAERGAGWSPSARTQRLTRRQRWLRARRARRLRARRAARRNRSASRVTRRSRPVVQPDVIPTEPVRNPADNRKVVTGPLKVVISLPDQRMDVFRGTAHVASTRVSTGRRGHATPKGVFSIIQKNRRHYSNIYGGAPMPYMQRLTWSGIALHAGVVPGYPASHGCIRMPTSFARKLFGMTDMGLHVVVTDQRKAPEVIEHPALFQPREPDPIQIKAEVAALDLADASNPDAARRSVAAYRDALTSKYVDALRKAFDPNAGAHPRESVRLVQRLLNQLGHDAGNPDGDLGSTTRGAIRGFQSAENLRTTGRVSDALIDRLYWRLAEHIQRLPEDQRKVVLTPPDLDKPLRILITRPSPRNAVREAQEMLADLGHDVGPVDGVLGRDTIRALKAFQDASGMKETGTISDRVLETLREKTGRTEPKATGRLMVRRGFRDIYSAPVEIKNPDMPLGAHLFSAMDFEKGDKEVEWTAMTIGKRARFVASLGNDLPEGALRSTPRGVLDRIVIPENVRKDISQMLTSGSSLIVSDGGWSRETGQGTDFIVETR